MNGVNLDRFQFEYDLTWMAFFQNDSGRTYARYGGREASGPETHLTKSSLIRVMNQVLDLHARKAVQPVSRYEPDPTTVTRPEQIPTLRSMMAKRKESSCIHCHDVKVARLTQLRDTGELAKEMVYTYPAASRLGFHLDADRQNVISRVVDQSAAANAGLRVGDTLLSCDEQRILTFADLSRVLELAPEIGTLTLRVERAGNVSSFDLALSAGWRSDADSSWRASTGVVGPGSGFWGVPVGQQKRKELDLADDELAIRVNFIWADHAKKSGIKHNDIVVSIDGKTHPMTIRQLQAYLNLNCRWGQQVPLVVRRNGQQVELTMNLPSTPLY